MIRLSKVSKYYYSRGMITSGISGVDLEFHTGEFVVISGESGSGKSTLLNVIGGLDTYEEGEMYIDGSRTSHFGPADFEEYRKQRVGTVFQEYDLIASYTVYQNIELQMQIMGFPEGEIRKRVPELISEVGLEKFAKTKAAKLSGGQQQRVAIARALAKDPPILLADEPTGNLDHASAMEIVELLAGIARGRLVIVVTHNFEQFRNHATRLVQMRDGRVIRDERAPRPVRPNGDPAGRPVRPNGDPAGRPVKTDSKNEIADAKKKSAAQNDFSDFDFGKENENLKTGSMLRLGIRNTFNIPSKFLLMLLVFVFTTFAVGSIYSGYKESRQAAAGTGHNTFFTDYSEERIVAAKADGGRFSDEDIKKISGIAGVKSLIKDDELLDRTAVIEEGYLSFSGFMYPADSFSKIVKGKVSAGRIPEGPDEALIQVNREDGAVMGEDEDVVGKTFSLMSGDGRSFISNVTITGIKYSKGSEFTGEGRIFLGENAIRAARANAYMAISTTDIVTEKETIEDMGSGPHTTGEYRLRTSTEVKTGEAAVPSDFVAYYKKGKAKGAGMTIRAENMFFTGERKFKISGLTTKKNFRAVTGLSKYKGHERDIWINPADLEGIYDGGIYQVSVIADDEESVRDISAALTGMGMKVLPLRDASGRKAGVESLTEVIEMPFLVLLVIVVFFVAYLVVRLILRSRSKYYSVLRMLGMDKKNIKRMIITELVLVITLAFGVFVLVEMLFRRGFIMMQWIRDLYEYISPVDHLILYVILVVMAVMIGGRYTRRLFGGSAMEAHRGEAAS